MLSGVAGKGVHSELLHPLKESSRCGWRLISVELSLADEQVLAGLGGGTAPSDRLYNRVRNVWYGEAMLHEVARRGGFLNKVGA